MEKTALLICDVQNAIVQMLHGENSGYLEKVANTIKAAREANTRVIYVRVAYRAGYPELSPNSSTLARLKVLGRVTESDPSTQFPEAITPREEDVIITKRRVSAFHATDLDLVLRSQNIDNLVIGGLSTSGVVMSTVRQGEDMDYRCTVLEDLCHDSDPAMHEACMKVLGKKAKILTSTDWAAELGQH
jgi:nicotinamidase-related amidase